jgi:hypothetical protein
MKEKIELLILLYKTKIADKSRLREIYEKQSKGGACISLTGEIQAYNAVLKDLNELKLKL